MLGVAHNDERRIDPGSTAVTILSHTLRIFYAPIDCDTQVVALRLPRYFFVLP